MRIGVDLHLLESVGASRTIAPIGIGPGVPAIDGKQKVVHIDNMFVPRAPGSFRGSGTVVVMSENSRYKIDMNFRELVQHLEDRIGYHQIPTNPAATGPRDLFECCALHHELMTELMQAIYKKNGCRRLTDPVNRSDTFKALTPIRLKVLRSSKTDIDVFHLIESLCTAIDQAFAYNEAQPNGERRRRQDAAVRHRKAEVIRLENFRYRRFKTLA